MQEKLNVYYYINICDNQNDLSVIENYIKVYINVYLGEFMLNKFVNCSYLFKHSKQERENETNQDTIKCGLSSFNTMYDKLKLKEANKTWFLYIANGNIKDIYKNVFVMLLNKNPSEKITNYSINTKTLDVSKKYTKYEKIKNLELLSATIQELYLTKETITYTNFV
jgi:hypothetical protein